MPGRPGTAAGAPEADLALSRAEALLDIFVEQAPEVAGDGLAAQRDLELAVHVDRRARALAGAGERDADVGVAALARAVDDAAHHRHAQPFDAGVNTAPFGHAPLDVSRDLGRQLLEEGAGGAPAARAGRDL